MEAILKELDKLLEVAQSQLPANPKSVRNEKLAKEFEKGLAEYFSGLEKAFPFHMLDEIYYKFVKVE
jgi:hypothetical protein